MLRLKIQLPYHHKLQGMRNDVQSNKTHTFSTFSVTWFMSNFIVKEFQGPFTVLHPMFTMQIRNL